MPAVGASPTLESAEAIAAVAEAAGTTVAPGDVPPPTLTYFHDDETDTWHLAWQVRALDIKDAALCLRLFKSNRDAGLLLFFGLLADAVLRSS